MFRFFSIPFLLLAATSFADVRPAWVEATADAVGPVVIDAIVAGAAQDLVVVEGGLEAGLRRGMVAEVVQAGVRKGRLLIAEATAGRAIALITELEPEQTLMAGDRVVRSLVRL